MVYKDKILKGSEIIFDYHIEIVGDKSLSESDIDSKAVAILKDLGWKELVEIRQHRTNKSEIDDHLRSKTIHSSRKGHADIYLLTNEKLRLIIDNKSPKESVEDGIEDAIFYANCLLEKDYDIRIVLSYNGINCILKVYDSVSKDWGAFTIDGEEINAFPSKELVELIYRHKDVNGINITENIESKNISNIIKGLKEIYRNVPHIQNDNQKTIDFTVSFIALKSILEKHSSTLGKSWTDLDVAEQRKLKEEIKNSVDAIIEDLENGYEEIFKIKEDPKGKIKAFDFLEVIKQFPNKVPEGGTGHLVQIFRKLNNIPHLHSSKFDLFGEVYQSLMDKHTRKIFGQFFTPRHLIKPLVRLFFEGEMERLVGEVRDNNAENPKTVCDPACGTGGFLTESFKYFATNTEGVDTIDLAKKTIYGFDIYPANAVRSRVNMYLAGDGFSKIDSLNSLKELDENEKKFDYILTNIPFGDGDYCVDTNVISNRRKEANFLIKLTKLLKPYGKCLVIVPDGILEAPTLSPLRRWIIQNCEIEKIIGLPKYAFAPYTHEKTYVLYLKKRPTPIFDLAEVKTERIWVYIVDTEGYANSDKKFRTKKTDENGRCLHDELSLWRDKKGAFHVSILEENWKKKEQPPDEEYTDELDNKIEGLKYGFIELRDVFEEGYTSYPTISNSKILELLEAEISDTPPEKITDLFEEGDNIVGRSLTKMDMKPEIETILTSKGVDFDFYNGKFYDRNTPHTERPINLLPEKYLRNKKIEAVSFEKFVEENNEIISEIKDGLKQVQDILERWDT